MLCETVIQMYVGKIQSFETPGARAQSPALNASFLGTVLYAMTDPSSCLRTLIHGTNMQTECIQEPNGNIIRDKQVVGEVLKFLPIVVRAFISLELVLVDVKAGDGAPEALPPGGQHAGLHHLPGLHEGHDVVDEAIRQGAQPVAAGQAAAACTGPLSFCVDLHGVSCLEHFLGTRPKGAC